MQRRYFEKTGWYDVGTAGPNGEVRKDAHDPFFAQRIASYIFHVFFTVSLLRPQRIKESGNENNKGKLQKILDRVIQSPSKLTHEKREFWLQLCKFSVRVSVCIVCSSVLRLNNLKLHKTLSVKNTFMQEKLILLLTLTPGLALTGFPTTRPCSGKRRAIIRFRSNCKRTSRFYIKVEALNFQSFKTIEPECFLKMFSFWCVVTVNIVFMYDFNISTKF